MRLTPIFFLTSLLAGCGQKTPAPPATVAAPTVAPPPTTAATTPPDAAAPDAAAGAQVLDPAEKVDIAGGVVPREQTKHLSISAEAPYPGTERSIVASTASVAFESADREASALLRTPLRHWFLTVDGHAETIDLTLVAPDNAATYPLGSVPHYKAPDCENSGFGCDLYEQASIVDAVAARDGRKLTVTLEMTHGDRAKAPRSPGPSTSRMTCSRVRPSSRSCRASSARPSPRIRPSRASRRARSERRFTT